MERFDLRLWPGFINAGGCPDFSPYIDQIVIDSRRVNSENALFVALEGSKTDGHAYLHEAQEAGARYALVSRERTLGSSFKKMRLLRVESPLRAFQEIVGAYRRQFSCPVLAITGSFGKTMVKDLLLNFLGDTKNVASSPESFNSQIGVALSLLQMTHRSELVIIEAAISQKGEIDFLREMIRPDYGILTAVGAKYSEGLGQKDSALKEMEKLFSGIPKSGWVIVQPRQPSNGAPVARELEIGASGRPEYEVRFPDGEIFRTELPSAADLYFLDSVNLALQASLRLGVPQERIKKVLQGFCPEPMRFEMWKSSSGLLVLNEPYGADPQSVDTALQRLLNFHEAGEKVFIFGGLRGNHSRQDYLRVGRAMLSAGIDRLLLVGGSEFEPLAKILSDSVPLTFHQSYVDAIQHARGFLKLGGTLLLKGAQRISLDCLNEALEGSVQTNQCFINLAAIETNLKRIKRQLPEGTRLMPMVKAEAYGTHAGTIARFLTTLGVDIFGVSYVDEAVALRRKGVRTPLFVLNAALYEVEKVIEMDLQVGVSHRTLIEKLEQEAVRRSKKIRVHLHVDTGMSRLGCRPEEALDLARKVAASPWLQLEGIMTHFACADDPAQDDFTRAQIGCFDQVVSQIESVGIAIPWKHAANSGAALRFDLPSCNMARVSLGLYGLKPSPESAGLKLALSLRSKIVGINTCRRGETVSYGRTHCIDRDLARIAVIPLGYFDGLHRHYSGKGDVMIRAQKAPMVGTICMDYFMVDVTDIPSAAIGDSVLIFGEDDLGHYLSPEELASKGNSISHELIACLGPRIQRIFVHEENASSC